MQRALAIAWTVTNGEKGHFPEQMHGQLIQEIQKTFRENFDAVHLGDGEFDGPDTFGLLSQKLAGTMS